MENQIVHSYVRYAKPKETKDPSLVPAIVLWSIVIGVVAIMLWQITLALTLVGAGYYAKTRLTARTQPTVAVETNITKPKRSYTRRVKINHYQLGKVSV